jgi:Zn-dependent oligopeptidase
MLPNKTFMQLPILSLVANYKKLLSYNEVVFLFHEFSHIIHNLFGKTKYCVFSGTNVEQDFVEIPAKILENLCWDKQFIKQFSSHYENQSTLPDQIINLMIRLKYIDYNINLRRQCVFVLYEQFVHTYKQFIDVCNGSSYVQNENTSTNTKSDIVISVVTEEDNMVLMKNMFQQLFSDIMMTSNNIGIKYNSKADNFIPGTWVNMYDTQEILFYNNIWSDVYAFEIYHILLAEPTFNFASRLKNDLFKYGGSIGANEIMNNFINRDYHFVPNALLTEIPKHFVNKDTGVLFDKDMDKNKESESEEQTLSIDSLHDTEIYENRKKFVPISANKFNY